MARFQILLVLLSLLILPLSGGAHHSLSTEFDTEKQMTVTGVVTTVEWMNPHAWVFLDVKEPASGKVKQWAFQLPSPNVLYRLGWPREPFKAGVVVTANGFAAKDGSTRGNAQEISSSGRILYASDRPVK